MADWFYSKGTFGDPVAGFILRVRAGQMRAPAYGEDVLFSLIDRLLPAGPGSGLAGQPIHRPALPQGQLGSAHIPIRTLRIKPLHAYP